MRYFIIILLTFFCFTANAHNPNEITYNFDVNEGSKTLTIHFTPKAAIDLIRQIKPELQEESIIKLDDYSAEFTDYFNKTIDLKIENNDIQFSFISAELHEHDATILLNLVSVPENYERVEMQITSYLNIYKRVENYVIFNTANTIFKHRLDKNNTKYAIKIDQQKKTNYWWMLFVLVIPFIYFLMKSKKVLPQNS